MSHKYDFPISVNAHALDKSIIFKYSDPAELIFNNECKFILHLILEASLAARLMHLLGAL